MDGSNDLFFMVRLNVLKKGYQEVTGIIESMEKRRHDLVRLHDLLVGMSDSIHSAASDLTEQLGLLEKRLDRLRDSAGEHNKERIAAGLNDLETAEAAMVRLTGYLDEVAKTVDKIKERSSLVDLANSSGDALSKVTDLANALDGIENSLENARSGEETKAVVRDAWKNYAMRLSDPAREFFLEYVSFLSGMALRNQGLDKEICRVADKLVSEWSETFKLPSKYLTLPAFQENFGTTPARIIQLGFPEWSIWSLPLAAHEFGHVVVSSRPDLNDVFLIKKGRKETKGEQETRLQRQEIAADVVATFAMGPAYACASILLRFSPIDASSTLDGEPVVARRAETIFKILELMSAGDGFHDSIIEDLRNAWNAAILQVRPGLNPSVLNQHNEKLKGWVETEQAAWLKRFWARLKGGPAIYTSSMWQAVATWSNGLAEGKTKKVYDELLGHEDLLEVLNAAWRSRIEHPKKTDTIDQSALQLWEWMEHPERVPKDEDDSRSNGRVDQQQAGRKVLHQSTSESSDLPPAKVN